MCTRPLFCKKAAANAAGGPRGGRQRPDKHPNPFDERGVFLDQFWAGLGPKPSANGATPAPNCPGKHARAVGAGFCSIRIGFRPQTGPNRPKAGPYSSKGWRVKGVLVLPPRSGEGEGEGGRPELERSFPFGVCMLRLCHLRGLRSADQSHHVATM